MFITPKRTLLLIDLNNTVIRALAVNKGLSYNGNITGGFFGFTRMLASAINALEPTNIIVCSDKKPYFREGIYKKYKKDRIRTEDDDGFYEALDFNKGKTVRLLNLLNIPVVVEHGYEADDWIAYFTRDFHTKFDRVVIQSNDTDLLSLLKYPNTFIYKSGTKKSILYGVKQFQDEYFPVTPETFDLYTAMVGSHNNFPGIKGIGPVNAKKILSDQIKLAKIKHEHKEHFIDAEKVLTLPYPDMMWEIPEDELLVKPKADITKIERLLTSQGINISSAMELAFNFYR